MKSRINKTEYRFAKYLSGTMDWHRNGKYHRDKDLPAVIHNTGAMSWYINGKFIKGK
jgi:hypothetical protein